MTRSQKPNSEKIRTGKTCSAKNPAKTKIGNPDADRAAKALKAQFETGGRLSSRNLYGKRIGRPLKAAQLDRLENRLPGVSLSADRIPLDKPVWLEVGFGAGEHLAWQAAHNPGVTCIGVEYFANGVAKALEHIETGGLTNVLIHHGDARDVLDLLDTLNGGPNGGPNGELSGESPGKVRLERVFVLHPDPWPKRRHWERRIIQTGFLQRLAALMPDKAELRIATDHPSYLTGILRVMQQSGEFSWTAQRSADWRGRRADWPQTRYEAKGLREGRPPTYLSYRRLPR